jgi:hypothetical protein
MAGYRPVCGQGQAGKPALPLQELKQAKESESMQSIQGQSMLNQTHFKPRGCPDHDFG